MKEEVITLDDDPPGPQGDPQNPSGNPVIIDVDEDNDVEESDIQVDLELHGQ